MSYAITRRAMIAVLVSAFPAAAEARGMYCTRHPNSAACGRDKTPYSPLTAEEMQRRNERAAEIAREYEEDRRRANREMHFRFLSYVGYGVVGILAAAAFTGLIWQEPK